VSAASDDAHAWAHAILRRQVKRPRRSWADRATPLSAGPAATQGPPGTCSSHRPPWLAGLGYRIGASTVWRILKNANVDPAPQRAEPTWRAVRAPAEGRTPGGDRTCRWECRV